MDTEDTLRRLIHREMRSHFSWHRIEKLEADGNGYDIVVSVQPNSREYVAAADLTVALKRHYRDVHLDKIYSFQTLNNIHLYSMILTCRSPKVVGLSWNPLRAA